MNAQMPRDHDQATTAPPEPKPPAKPPEHKTIAEAERQGDPRGKGNGDNKLGPGERWMTPAENRAADKAEAKAAKHT